MDVLFELLEKLLFGENSTSAVVGRARRGNFGRRRSVVRLIGSFLPFPKAKRVRLDLQLSADEYPTVYILDGDTSRPCSEAASIDEGLDSASSLYHNSDKHENSDMRKLLDEIKELKMKMNEILERQKIKTCCDSAHSFCGSRNCGPAIDCSPVVPQRVAPPPPPPPPPPPLPPPLFPVLTLHSSTPTTTPFKRKRSKRKSDTTSPCVEGLNAVLQELKQNKISLKPIDKSPGGRPMKKRDSDVRTPGSGKSDSLADILRKRYLKSQPPESDQP